jgi:hypothetical protein
MGIKNMKRLVLMFTCLGLAACGGTHGLRDDVPKLSSHTDKDVATYVECVRAKWTALSAKVDGSSKEGEGRVSATDKNGNRELLSLAADGKGAQVTMYERQSNGKDYNSHYRDEAVSCL